MTLVGLKHFECLDLDITSSQTLLNPIDTRTGAEALSLELDGLELSDIESDLSIPSSPFSSAMRPIPSFGDHQRDHLPHHCPDRTRLIPLPSPIVDHQAVMEREDEYFAAREWVIKNFPIGGWSIIRYYSVRGWSGSYEACLLDDKWRWIHQNVINRITV